MRRSDVGRLLALAAIWGASFIFIRVLAPALGPILTATTRVLIGGGALVVYCRVAGIDAELRRFWRQYLVLGIFNSSLPFVLFAYAALHVPASYSVILNSTTPLFTALLAVPLLGERLTFGKIAGLVAGAAGVGFVSRAGPITADLELGMAVAACLGATMFYAVSSIYMKKRAPGARPIAIAGWSQVFAGIVLLPFVVLMPAPGPITSLVVANVLGLALICSSIAYVLYYRLIADVGPTRALTVAFLMPAFGMVWGALFLRETITWPMIAGCVLIVAGTGAVLRPGSRR